ncbi:hypothetical protein [Kitasatospora sp. NPDC057500]|uniref:hypothetical protein n=1 Tax=Kitasatospora sp. NPDC057500 TaxID=3346151 RepID=UPI0036BC2132
MTPTPAPTPIPSPSHSHSPTHHPSTNHPEPTRSPSHGGELPGTGAGVGKLIGVIAAAMLGVGLLLALIAWRGRGRHS